MAGRPHGADDPDVSALERVGDLERAAELAESRGRYAQASGLWERACRFDRAARAALSAQNPKRAILLAARVADKQIEQEAIVRLAADPGSARVVADQLALSGQLRSAGALRLAIGDAAAAARDLERASLFVDAARAFTRAGDLRGAARCFEAALASDPGDQRSRLELARLLEQAGRPESAIERLQQIPDEAPERPHALARLRRLFTELGLVEAAADAERELARLGVEPSQAPPSERAPTPVQELLFGRYAIARMVATTPTARVYEAIDRLSDEHVALKVFAAATLHDIGRDALSRFEREARVLGELSHPSIVRLRAYLPEGPAVVLDWMEGGSLADLVAKAPIAPARAVEITSSVLAALGEAHRRGILHRDIKPANVLFDAAGAPKLSDFGAAHVSDAAATVTAGVMGTLAYMAPEQRSGQPASIGSDVYGAGALFWHALTGAPPSEALPPLSSELERVHLSIAKKLIAPEAERPADTHAARALLGSVKWPTAVPPARPARLSQRAASERPHSLRLEPISGSLFRDTLLDRTLLILPADPPTLARVLPFARADDPLLPQVLAYRTEEKSIWLEHVEGALLERPLTAAERESLRVALGRLHRAGGVHGRIDAQHLVVRGGVVSLTFSPEPNTASADDDLAALARL